MRKAAELPRPYLLSSNLPSVPARLAIDRLRRGLAVEDRVEFGAHLGQRIRLVARLCGVGNQIIKLIVARARLFLRPADRSEERRVGIECVSTCRSRWSPYH